MNSYSKALVLIHQLVKLYHLSSHEICESFSITQAELDILSFLHNNPNQDTAKTICEIRFLKKSIVSQSIDKLVKRGFIEKTADTDDRRLLHLALTPAADKCIERIDAMQSGYFRNIFSCYTEEELESMTALAAKLENHITDISEEKIHG